MNFKTGNWNKEVNVRDFIQRNYTPYDGGKEFLTAPTERTKALWNQLLDLMKVERERKGVYDIDEKTISTITAHNAGYINKDLEQIVGLQTDAPLKRAIMPFGGIRLIHTQLEAYGRQMDPIVDHVFKYRKTHNDGVFDVYTDEMKRARHAGIMTGLPDAYGRGRIIGDYRRVALYGVDFLIAQKQAAKKNMVIDVMDSDHIRKREEIAEQIKALAELKEMAAKYGFDISRPAENTKEAIQWLYFGYLAAVKEQNGAAMSIGRISTFLDCYAEQDLKNGVFTEEQIQEFVCVSSASSASRPMTSCSPATRPGLRNPSAACPSTDATWSPRCPTASCTRWSISVLRRSRTSRFSGARACRKTSSASARKSPLRPPRFSTRTTT